jgi:hypothetical protein
MEGISEAWPYMNDGSGFRANDGTGFQASS